MGTLLEDQYKLLIISRSVRLRKKNVLDKRCRENTNTQFIFSNPPPPKIVPLVRECGKILYKDVSKSSRTVLVKRSLLTLDVKFLHHLQSTPFCTNTAVPAFLPCLEASLEVPFWNCVKYPLRFLLNLFNGVESSTLQPKLQLGEEEKVAGGQIG